MNTADLKTAWRKLRKAYKRTERQLDTEPSAKLERQYEAQFHQLVEIERQMIAAGIAF